MSNGEPERVRRVLSIDGGGIKGVFPAAFLAEIERDLPEPLWRYFDLIVGTSTGGILTLGLGLGFRAQDLLGFYEEHGRGVFNGNRMLNWLRHWALIKYPRTSLEAALRSVFGERTIGEAKTRLVIPSLHLDTGKVYIFKTAHHPSLVTDYRRLAVEAAMATAAAPSYFPAFALSGDIPLIDGGVWANNPLGVAAVEAVGLLGWPGSSVRILSLGCSQAAFDPGFARKWPFGRFYWAKKFIEASFAGQDSAAYGTAKLLVGEENVYRISPLVPKRIALDSVSDIDRLRGLAVFEARAAKPTLLKAFFSEVAEPFAALR
jgi:hypothetical protein